LSFNQTGGIDARFSNGQVVEVAKVAMTKFSNQDGLERIGGNYFRTTANSGQGQVGVAGSVGFGTIQGGALESSNVDLTVELTNMILAQRMFESNARVVTAADRVLDTLVNLGR
jgi:flagellar hook protein FlgE